ncbi:hypothetical protein TCE0_044f17354 [Talaromyces pinophilus]|uniref:Uncharacterized protein n=1 Tax=Talaromyces pinophilus TaxID=128442 RepID=A0A478ECW1_TALPI|nr:hypothetical protein TCE0_044f17354 [Talaromyces pinophilus]
MEKSRTISEIKTSFIRNQIRILSAPIAPQEGWRDFAPETEDDLSDKVVEEVVQKLNTTLKQHNRVVYSNQAIQHVARQIESLYWESVKNEVLSPSQKSTGVEIGSDLSNHLVIEKLPSQYRGDDASSEEKERYKLLYERLVALDNRRQVKQKQLAQYKQLEALLEPLRNPQENIQPNLLTRDGELVREIDKMRIAPTRETSRAHRESMTTNGNNNAAAMGNYMDNSPNVVNMANMSRQSMSPSPSQMNGSGGGGGGGGGGAVGGGGGNGMGNNNNMMMNGLPMNAGHQMDLNNLYDMVVEFSDILKNNREMTRGIVQSAEEIMRRSTAEGTSPDIHQPHESQNLNAPSPANVAPMGIMVEQIRNYCQNNNMYFLAQKKEYNALLQAERDAHLSSRLDRDHWHAQTMRLAEMLRTAYRLRCEEDQAPTTIIQALQSEVRALRSAIGLEPEKPEEETGYEFLKDLSPPVVD